MDLVTRGDHDYESVRNVGRIHGIIRIVKILPRLTARITAEIKA
jgi:hypothetical protein